MPFFFCLFHASRAQVDKNGGANLHRTPDPSTFPNAPGTPKVINVTESSVSLTWTRSQDRSGATPLIG